ncbi:MAG: DMT family transporter [Firmicutes bacterium]|nr:DMT family transporter [Bacillota bacterium]
MGTKVALVELEPMQLLAMRWTVGALIFLLLGLFKVINLDFRGRPMKWLLLTGLLQPCIYSPFETIGVDLTTASESAILIATIPLMVLVIGELFFHKKTSRVTKLSIVMAFAGVVICIAFAPGFSLGGKAFGFLMLGGAILAGGFYSYASSLASENYNAIEITASIAIMGCICFNAMSFAMGYGVTGWQACFADGRLFFSVLFLGVCCSCLCYLIFNYVLGKLPPAIATNLVANGTTAVGVLAGCLMAGDPFGWYTVVGLALTITGIVLSSTQKS